jgi:hypothetical protein
MLRRFPPPDRRHRIMDEEDEIIDEVDEKEMLLIMTVVGLIKGSVPAPREIESVYEDARRELWDGEASSWMAKRLERREKRLKRREKLLNRLSWVVLIAVGIGALSHWLFGFPADSSVWKLFWVYMAILAVGAINAIGFIRLRKR